MMMFPKAPMPQLICLSPQNVSDLVDSLTQFINHSMMDAAANIGQFLARCPPPCQPPPSGPHVCPLEFPAPKPRRKRRRRRRRPRTSRPLPSSFGSLLSTEVDEVIKSIEQLPVVKSPIKTKDATEDLICTGCAGPLTCSPRCTRLSTLNA